MPISAIIPAYNEENTIGAVLSVLKKTKVIDEILVVDDGSTDNTAQIAELQGVKLISLPQNMGKGAAIKMGLEKSSHEIILFLDADLLGLTEKHVLQLVTPVLSQKADMTVGVFRSGRTRTDWAHRLCPYLSGQRAVRKEALKGMLNMEATGYGIEIALTRYMEKEHHRTLEVELDELTHVMKEEKLGIFLGFVQRMKMYWQIYRGLKLIRR